MKTFKNYKEVTLYYDKLESENSVKCKEEINEWLGEFIPRHLDFVKNCRLAFLHKKLKIFEKRREELILAFNGLKLEQDWFVEVINDYLIPVLRQINRIKNEMEQYEKPKLKKEEITEEMIEQARRFPINQIIDVNECGYALCPFHNDHNPSAYCKNNFLHCFSCNESADTIKLYMHLNGVNFQEAVKALSL